MAKFIANGPDGKEIMANATLYMDMTKTYRQAFGFFHWRLKAFHCLIWLATKILRCKWELKTKEN